MKIFRTPYSLPNTLLPVFTSPKNTIAAVAQFHSFIHRTWRVSGVIRLFYDCWWPQHLVNSRHRFDVYDWFIGLRLGEKCSANEWKKRLSKTLKIYTYRDVDCSQCIKYSYLYWILFDYTISYFLFKNFYGCKVTIYLTQNPSKKMYPDDNSGRNYSRYILLDIFSILKAKTELLHIYIFCVFLNLFIYLFCIF